MALKQERGMDARAWASTTVASGAVVLVTGGTGSFGSTVVRRLLAGDVG